MQQQHKPHLLRGLNARHIRFIALGSAIGTGLFYGSASAIKAAGPAVLLAYLIGGAAGGAWVVSMHVYMTAVGLTAIPGMAIVQASSLLNYIIGMVIAFGVAFTVSLVLKYKTDAE